MLFGNQVTRRLVNSYPTPHSPLPTPLRGTQPMVRGAKDLRIEAGVGEKLGEDGVDGVEQRRIAAILVGDDARLGARGEHLAREGVVGLGIGAAEAIDRLLWIADDDRFSFDERAASIARQA